jgi:hypothetical protein
MKIFGMKFWVSTGLVLALLLLWGIALGQAPTSNDKLARIDTRFKAGDRTIYLAFACEAWQNSRASCFVVAGTEDDRGRFNNWDRLHLTCNGVPFVSGGLPLTTFPPLRRHSAYVQVVATRKEVQGTLECAGEVELNLSGPSGVIKVEVLSSIVQQMAPRVLGAK